MDDIVEHARLFAMAAHSAVGQVRKYTGEPYWTHTQAVASMVAGVCGVTPAMIAAAHLHDVCEDTSVSVNLIRTVFGGDVASMVEWLTDTPVSVGNRATRKTMDRARLALAPDVVQTIKVCDLIHNCTSIVQHDPKFAVVYLEEKRKLLTVLSGADDRLLACAWAQVDNYLN